MELYTFLSSPPLAIIILLVPFIYLLFRSKRRSTEGSISNYNLPPSPPRLPIIGNLHQLGELPHRSLAKLSQQHGPVMFLQLGQVPAVVVSSPDMAKEVLKTHDSECCSRPFSHGAMRLSYNFLDVAFGPYSEYWTKIRKLCVMELFTLNKVRSFGHVKEKEVARLINSISEVSCPIEVNEKIFSLTNNVICSIAFGKSYDDGKQFEGYDKFEEAIAEAMAVMSSFWAADFFPKLGWIVDVMSGLHRRLEKVFRNFDTFFDRVIDEHLDPQRPKAEHHDITDVLLGLSKNENAHVRLSRDHVKSILMQGRTQDIFIGAIATSSVTMVWAITELAKNPRVMKKAQAEICACVGRKPTVSEHEIPNLKYLEMVVKETFRLHPPATLLLPHESMQHCKIGGYDVPSNTRIYVNAWAIGRDLNAWTNPYEFYPDRFQENDVDFKGQHFQLIPFGSGRRICPGLLMGSTAIKFTLANLLHCFDWEMPDGVKMEDISVEEEAGLTVHKKYPLHLVPVKYDWRGQTDYI